MESNSKSHEIPQTKQTLRGRLVRRMEFDGIEIHRWNLNLKELEWNLIMRSVCRNSILSLKPRNDDFLKIVEFNGIQRIPSNSFREPSITKEFVIPIPSTSFKFREPNGPLVICLLFRYFHAFLFYDYFCCN